MNNLKIQQLSELNELQNSLKKIGLTEKILKEAVWQGYLNKNRTTSNHPPTVPGIFMWSEVIVSLREQLIPKGWYKTDEKNFSLVTNDSFKVSIAVCTGDKNTGILSLMSSNKNPKGSNTEKVISTNGQIDMFQDEFNEILKKNNKNAYTTWVLLIHHAENEIRYELSKPLGFNKGKVVKWGERIVLAPLDLNRLEIPIDTITAPDIDITINKKV